MNERRLIAFDLRGVPIVYRQHTGHSVSVSGAITNSYTDTTIVALVGPALTDPVEGSPADRYIVGSLVARVKVSDVPSPSTTDRVLYDGREYSVVETSIARDMLVCDLICRELDI